MRQTIKRYEARYDKLERKVRSLEKKISITSTTFLTEASIAVVVEGASIGATALATAPIVVHSLQCV